MRDASTYRGARKKAMRQAGVKAQDTPFRKIDIRQPTLVKRGFALPLKAVDGGIKLEPSIQTPCKFTMVPEFE